MPIQVSCSCGKVFRVKNDRAGQKGRCPECGQKIVVPFPVLEADDHEEPVPWNTFPEEWTGEPPPTAEGLQGIDLGIDLKSAPIPPPKPPPPADDEPEVAREDVEPEPISGDKPDSPLPAHPPTPPVPNPAAPAPSPAPAPPVRPQPLQVVVVGIRMTFEEMISFLFMLSFAMLFVSFIIGLVLGILFIMLRAFMNPHGAP